MRQTKQCVDCGPRYGRISIDEFANPEDDCCLGCEKERENFLSDMKREHGIEEQHDLKLEAHP